MILREKDKPVTTEDKHPTVQIGNVVVMEEVNMPRSSWRLGKLEQLFKGHGNQVRRAHVKIVKTNTVAQRPVSRLYKIEGKEDNANSDILKKDNILAENINGHNVNMDSDHSTDTSNRSKQDATIIGELKRKYISDANIYKIY